MFSLHFQPTNRVTQSMCLEFVNLNKVHMPIAESGPFHGLAKFIC